MKIALEKKSTVLASNAVHHRVDSLSSIVALVAIGGANLMSNAAWLDPVGGLLVSLMVVRAGWSNTGLALLELADAAVEDSVQDSVRDAAKACLESKPVLDLLSSDVTKQMEVRDVAGVKSGQNLLMDVQLAVPASLSMAELQEVEKLVREQVGTAVKGVRRLKVRFVAADSGSKDFTDEFIPASDDDIPNEGSEHSAAEKKRN